MSLALGVDLSIFIPAIRAQPDELQVVALQDEPVFPCHRLLEDLDGRVGEFHLHPAVRAYKMVVVLVIPDVLVPHPPGACVFPDGGPAYDARLDEQCQVAVHGGQRQGVPLCIEKVEHVVGMEMAINVANSSQ